MYEKEIGNLIDWLESWNYRGAYKGPVIHRLSAGRTFLIHETEWTQAAMIEGYLNLFENLQDRKYLSKAIEIAKNDLKKYNFKSHKYKYAGHEDHRFTSLVHCSLINSSLLRLCNYVNQNLKQEIIKTVEDNIFCYVIDKLYVKNYGAFKVSEIDFYSGVDRFVLNMNAEALKSFVLFIKTKKDRTLEEYIKKITKWIIGEKIVSKNRLTNNSLPYQRINKDDKRIDCVSIYEGLTISALTVVYKYYPSRSLKKLLIDVANHLACFIDPETNLFYHTYINGKLKKYPQFVAGSSFCLKGLNDVENLFNIDLNSKKIFEKILKYQLPNGAFKNFVGYNTLDNNRSKDNNIDHVVFEDIYPTVSWNAHMFEFLSRFIDNKLEYSLNTTFYFKNRNLFYCDSKSINILFSFSPVKSFAFIIYYKKFTLPLFNLSYFLIKNLILKRSLQ